MPAPAISAPRTTRPFQAYRPGFDRNPPLANPIGGPVWLEGAEPGDLLEVRIEAITVADYSWTAVGPNRGPLGASTRWPELSSQYSTKIFRHAPGPSGTTRDGTLHFSQRIQWPITPFVGTMGVAPDREVTTSGDGQGPWGGNLDIRDLAPLETRSICPSFIRGPAFTWAMSTPVKATLSSPGRPRKPMPPFV